MSIPLPACRVIVDSVPGSGAWNMAVDEVLLETALQGELCTLRWYRWERATLSLGYFQRPGTADVPAHLRDLPVVRRLSGGGAIVHDRELTYSCALAASHPFVREPRQLYTRVHLAVIELLATYGLTPRLRGASAPDLSGAFLCFGRGDPDDVVIGDAKILGSAQRRRKGAILQHGSLILRRSAVAPQFAGVCDFAGLEIEPSDLLEQLVDRTGWLFSDFPEREDLSAAELARARELAAGYQSERRSGRLDDEDDFSRG
jgi:lipoate-protein ligase A